jgi:hypothetical protein
MQAVSVFRRHAFIPPQVCACQRSLPMRWRYPLMSHLVVIDDFMAFGVVLKIG